MEKIIIHNYTKYVGFKNLEEAELYEDLCINLCLKLDERYLDRFLCGGNLEDKIVSKSVCEKLIRENSLEYLLKQVQGLSRIERLIALFSHYDNIFAISRKFYLEYQDVSFDITGFLFDIKNEISMLNYSKDSIYKDEKLDHLRDLQEEWNNKADFIEDNINNFSVMSNDALEAMEQIYSAILGMSDNDINTFQNYVSDLKEKRLGRSK